MLRLWKKQPIHHWVQKFVDNSARYIIFLFEKTNRKRCNLEHQTNFIMNANQLYTTEHKMPRFLRVNDQNFEYVNRKWRKIPLDSLEIYLDSIAQKCENNNLLSFGRLALELFLQPEGKMNTYFLTLVTVMNQHGAQSN